MNVVSRCPNAFSDGGKAIEAKQIHNDSADNGKIRQGMPRT